jgi:hypothetical protein
VQFVEIKYSIMHLLQGTWIKLHTLESDMKVDKIYRL